MKTLFSWMVALSFCSLAMAAEPKEIYRLYKCYGVFVGERMPINHTLLVKLKNGQISAVDACMQLLQSANLAPDGSVATAEGQKILRKVNEYHHRWFTIQDPLNATVDYDRITTDVIDMNEHAFHLTYTLLKSNEPYKNVVTRDYTIEAIRQSANPQPVVSLHPLNNYDKCNFGYQSSLRNTERSLVSDGTVIDDAFPLALNVGDNWSNCNDPVTGYFPWYPRVVNRGTLVGLKPFSGSNILNYPQLNIDVNKPLGAGVIGTQSYLAGNIGLLGKTDGAIHMKRRWGKYVLSDLLCRELPALRRADVTDTVKTNSDITFRNSSTCMACHMSIDTMSSTIRNVIMGNSMSTTSPYFSSYMTFFYRTPTTMGSGPLMVETGVDNNHWQRPPEGRLFFRGYNGTLYSEALSDLDDLGEAITTKDDYYICAAKKYYKFLTGFEVRLPDEGDSANLKLSASERVHWNKVVGYGKSLKTHQNLQQLLKDIISSDSFINE